MMLIVVALGGRGEAVPSREKYFSPRFLGRCLVKLALSCQ